MSIYLEKYNIYMSRHESFASHISASSIYTSTSFKPSNVISSEQSSIFQEITNKLYMDIGTLIFNNELPFRTCESRDMDDIILKAKKVPREYNITSREEIRGPILEECYTTMREIQTRNLLNEAEVFRL